ncbi:hypothetical protein [Haliangium ochraceum]|uniref:Terpene synthase n=1 Tax=Haliangium ochraceum (strain DSM 14365 / JCM 11303 / SMP-2) TaxID=502025 RepID=D0LT79_HALO1|nr:hypothetical protein [Haliangium ochraceum]ACY19215.1 hypothetical protein Hoch_6751 [Haliangium ochraceum DSM 14365]
MVSGQPPGAPHTPERWLQGQIRDWLARHRLMPDTQARRFAHVVAVFCSRCAPAPEPAALAPAGSRGDAADAHAEARLSAAKLVALVFTLDELALAPDDGDAPDAFESFSRRLASALGDDDDDDNDDNDDDPRLAALGDFLAALPQHPRAGREALRAAVLDYLDAAREEAWLGRGADARARGAGRDWLGDALRLRPLVVAVEPYLRCWQLMLGCVPARAPAYEARAAQIRAAHPAPALDRALDAARTAHARGCRRRAQALGELEALTIVLAYLANDLGSRDRDRAADADAPNLEANVVLALERFLGGPSERNLAACDDFFGHLYQAGVARVRAFLTAAEQLEHARQERLYAALLGRIVDGNLDSTIALSRPAAGEAPDAAPRYRATVLAGLARVWPREPALPTAPSPHLDAPS